MVVDIAAIMKETLVAGRLKPAVSVVLIGVSSVLTVTNVEERLRIHRRCKPDGTHSSCDMSVIKNPPVNLPVKRVCKPTHKPARKPVRKHARKHTYIPAHKPARKSARKPVCDGPLNAL